MPTVQDVRDVIISDPVLTNVAIQYRPQGAIAEFLLPTLPVKQSSGRIPKYGKEAFRREYTQRGVGSTFRRVDWSVDGIPYFCQEHGLEIPVDDRIVANSQLPIDPFTAATMQLVDMLTLAKEFRVKEAILNALGSGYRTTPSVKWDQANSTPITDLKTAIRTVQQRIGVRPTTVAMSRAVFDVLSEHPTVQERLKYTGKDLTTEILARWLDIREVVVGEMIYNASPEGASENMQYVWDDTVVIAFVTQSPAINMPSFGYCPTVKNFTVERYREEPTSSTVIRVRHEVAEVVTAPDAGYLLTDVLASI